MSTLPFDRVVVRDGGVFLSLSASQFLDLPLHQRVRFILQRDIEFHAGPSAIDTSTALRALLAGADARHASADAPKPDAGP
ncbi:MAG TPA: hypothetical protein VG389_12840 [Myxococcota bacterium]|jgi:hypothetical protein|nr:hypothetical protein [Myxococcota bacterium]